MGSPVKTQVENGLSKIFDFRGQKIDVSDQDVFNLKYSGLHDKKGNKTNIKDPLTVAQMWSGRFLRLWWQSTHTRMTQIQTKPYDL